MEEMMKQMAMQGEADEMGEGSDLAAKMEVLKQLHQMASDLLAGDLDSDPTDVPGLPVDGMEKVEVMAPDEEGLEAGLEKARELVKKKDLTDELL